MKLQKEDINDIEELGKEISPKEIKIEKKLVYIRKKRRILFIPNKYTREKQKLLLRILSKIKLPNYIFSKKGKSYIDMAKFHLGDEYLINLDIKDFYPSIHNKRLIVFFQKLGISIESSKNLGFLTSIERQVPQGFITSPILSNLIFLEVDKYIFSLLNSRKIKYSRYVDDITISSHKSINLKLIDKIEKILRSKGFKLNKNKTDIYNDSEIKTVLGLQLKTDHLDISTSYLEKVGDDINWLYIFKQNGIEDDFLISRLKGEVNFIKQVNPNTYQGVVDKLDSDKLFV